MGVFGISYLNGVLGGIFLMCAVFFGFQLITKKSIEAVDENYVAVHKDSLGTYISKAAMYDRCIADSIK